MTGDPHHSDLEVVDNEYLDRDYNIDVSIPEFNCVCPRTGLPDFATIKIHYIPDRFIVELKSLKEYFFQFRTKILSYERLINVVYDDLTKVYKPDRLRIVMEFNARGGISSKLTIDSDWVIHSRISPTPHN